MVMGGDSCSEGCGFGSQHQILDGYFFTFIFYKNCIVCLKRRKYRKKRPGMTHFLKKHTKGNKKLQIRSPTFHNNKNGF